MKELSPIDASLLALIAENRNSAVLVKKLLTHISSSAKKIAINIVSQKTKVSKADRITANAIRHWSNTNKYDKNCLYSKWKNK